MLPNNQLDTTTYANRTKSGLPKRQNQTHHCHKNQTHTCWVYCKAPLLLACLLVACFQLFRCHGHQQAPHECPEWRGSTSKTPDKTKTTPKMVTKIDHSLPWGVGDLPAIWHTAGQCWSSPNAGRCSRGTPKSCSQVPAGQTTSTSRSKITQKDHNTTTMTGPLPAWVCWGASLCLAILWVVSFVLFYTDVPEEHQNTAQNG